MSLLSFLGFGNNLKKVLRNGAVVIDVRTGYEFDQGHVPHSINIPVDRIVINAPRIKDMHKPIIFCCASGSRSAEAVRIMQAKGLKQVYNGGNWERLARIANSL